MELEAANVYVEEIVVLNEKDTTKPVNVWGSLLFVKENNKKIRGVVDYCALSRISKRNKAPLPRSDEMLDILETLEYFRSST